ncbi:MAG TPA: hypothetical protein VMB26_08905 [Candidatus Binataceae bacterium]|nr:hypothetical protein [Candidatus Binataceae bacterium]
MRGYRWLIAGLALLLCGCFFDTWAYSKHGGGTDTAIGESHEVNYPVADAYSLVQDVLRGEGILFDQQPDYAITTLWRNADIQPDFWGGLLGVQPSYRYEIRVLPEGSAKSKIIVNVRADDIPDNQIPQYEASRRFDIFNKIDELAAKLPPPSRTPLSGGVNFALLPKEDLKGLAKRVTGNEDNWREIAKDNGIATPSDVSPFQTVWVRNDLIKSKAPPPPPKSDHVD